MKVLVAGANGYLGRFVVREFKRRGYWVRALARNPGRLAALAPTPWTTIFGSRAVHWQSVDGVLRGRRIR